MMRYFYIMGKYEEALRCGRRASVCYPAFKGFRDEQDYYYMYSLTLLAVCKTSSPLLGKGKEPTMVIRENDKATDSTTCKQSTSQLLLSEEEYLAYMNIVTNNQKNFKKLSDAAAINYRHQYLLVEAELARVR